MTNRLDANVQFQPFENACNVLREATDSGKVTAASICVLKGKQSYWRILARL